MPQPTWLYTQGLAGTWNQDPIFSGEKSVQPEAQEILVQAMSVVAAGGKGLMYFQVAEKEARKNPKSWQAIADFNRMIEPVREDLRSGDLTGMVGSEGGLIVDMIRSENKIIVPVISLRTKKEVGDLKCASAFVTEIFLIGK